jgi:uncharacterized protein (TIRG00374 family)
VSDMNAEGSGSDSGAGEGASTKTTPSRGGIRWLLDWRVWLGVIITVVCVWLAVRGIPLSEVMVEIRKANFWQLLLFSAPFYVMSVYFRALRWRHLTNPLAPISRVVLFRSTAIGFMVNNLMPLRLGEFVRSWTLGREAGISVGAVLGTVVLERVLDVAAVLLLAFGSLAFVGMGSDVGGVLQQGSKLLLPVGLAPLLALLVLRGWPEQSIALTLFLLRPFPARFSSLAEYALRSFMEGLGALSGGSHIFWIVLHSATIWLVASTGPILVGLWVFGVDLGSPMETLLTSWILLGAVGVAVAIPSAPGFIGPYQLAFKAVLVRFGVDPATAFAMAMLVWFVFWICMTLQGLLVLRGAHTNLSEITRTSE